MIRTKLFLACALAFAVSLAGTAASAQEPTNQITYFTFSAPFELPGGKTLPAGKYVFKIVDSPSNRHIVTVMSEDQQTVHATLLAIPAQRMEPSNEPEVRFMEAEASAAPAVRTWWYPGRTIGHEFIYPKDQARRLAARQREGVLTTAGDTAGDDAMRTGDLTRIGANGQEAAVAADAAAAETSTRTQTTASAQTSAETTSAQTSASAQTTPAPSPQPAPEPTTAAQPRTSAPQTAQATQPAPAPDTNRPTPTAAATERTELPRTASPLPLIALLGLGSLIGAGALRGRK